MWHRLSKQAVESRDCDTLARCTASTRKALEKALNESEGQDRLKGRK